MNSNLQNTLKETSFINRKKETAIFNSMYEKLEKIYSKK